MTEDRTGKVWECQPGEQSAVGTVPKTRRVEACVWLIQSLMSKIISFYFGSGRVPFTEGLGPTSAGNPCVWNSSKKIVLDI